jgi:hypothetical protein
MFDDLIDLSTYRDLNNGSTSSDNYELSVLDYDAPWGSSRCDSPYRIGSATSRGYSGELEPSAIPAELEGACMLLGPDVRESTSDPCRVRHVFTLKQRAYVYVLFLDGARIPTWLRRNFTAVLPDYDAAQPAHALPMHHRASSICTPQRSKGRWKPLNILAQFTEWAWQTQIERSFNEKGDCRFAVYRSREPFSAGRHTLPAWEQPRVGVDVTRSRWLFQSSYRIVLQPVDVVDAALASASDAKRAAASGGGGDDDGDDGDDDSDGDDATTALYAAILNSDVSLVKRLCSTISTEEINAELTTVQVSESMRRAGGQASGVEPNEINTVMRLAVHAMFGRIATKIEIAKLLLRAGFDVSRQSSDFIVWNWGTPLQRDDERDTDRIAAAHAAQPSWQHPPYFFDELPALDAVIGGQDEEEDAVAARESQRSAAEEKVTLPNDAIAASKAWLCELLPLCRHPILAALIFARTYGDLKIQLPSKSKQLDDVRSFFRAAAVSFVNAILPMDGDGYAVAQGKPIVANILSGPRADDCDASPLMIALATHDTAFIAQPVIFDYMAHRWTGSDLMHAWRRNSFVERDWPNSYEEFKAQGFQYGIIEGWFLPRTMLLGNALYRCFYEPFAFLAWFFVTQQFRSFVFSPQFQHLAASLGQLIYVAVYHSAMAEAGGGLGVFSPSKVALWVLSLSFLAGEIGALSTASGRREYFGGPSGSNMSELTWNLFDWLVFGGILISSVFTTAVVRWGTFGVVDASRYSASDVGEVGYNVTAACGILLYARILEIVMVADSLGPLITIIGAMTRKLVVLAVLLLTMLLAFAQYFFHVFGNLRKGLPGIDEGSALEAFGPHDASSSVAFAFTRSCVSLFGTFIGEFALDDFFAGEENNAYTDWRYGAAFVAGVIFVLLVTILVANLLIAVVSNLYNPEATWPDYLFSLTSITMKYELAIERDALPPPFNILQLPFAWLGVGVVKEYPDRALAMENVLVRARATLALPAEAFREVMSSADGHRRGVFGRRVARLERKFARRGLAVLYASDFALGDEHRREKRQVLVQLVTAALLPKLPKMVLNQSGGAKNATLRSINETLIERARIFDEVEAGGIDALLHEKEEDGVDVTDAKVPRSALAAELRAGLRAEVKRELRHISPTWLTLDRGEQFARAKRLDVYYGLGRREVPYLIALTVVLPAIVCGTVAALSVFAFVIFPAAKAYVITTKYCSSEGVAQGASSMLTERLLRPFFCLPPPHPRPPSHSYQQVRGAHWSQVLVLDVALRRAAQPRDDRAALRLNPRLPAASHRRSSRGNGHTCPRRRRHVRLRLRRRADLDRLHARPATRARLRVPPHRVQLVPPEQRGARGLGVRRGAWPLRAGPHDYRAGAVPVHRARRSARAARARRRHGGRLVRAAT